MALTKQMAALLGKLLDLSRQQKVDWQETADENAFLAPLSKFVITVIREDSGRYKPDYRLRIADEAGRILEEMSADMTDGREWEVLSELFELARRRALQVEAQLSELLSSLDGIR